ncbi:MAG TPA: hypothetical protein PLY93_01610 [Turneriella sp.]|nr:hypothetical protein [Turneriella sp.]
MVRVYIFVILAFALALGAYIAERFVLVNRATALSEVRFDSLRSDIERIDQEINERNRQGEFFRYLGVRPHGNKFDQREKEVRELNPNHDLIESALVLTNHFKTLVRSGRDLSLQERTLLSTQLTDTLLADTGLLRRYNITDFTGKRLGYAVFIIRPDLKKSTTALFVTSYDFETVAAFSHDAFNAEEKKLVEGVLSRLTSNREAFSIRGREYVALKQVWLDANVYLFQVSPLPPIYTYWSIYFTLILFIVVFADILRVYRAKVMTRREVSGRILDNHRRALAMHKQTFETLAKLNDENVEKEINANFLSAQPSDPILAVEEKIRLGRAHFVAKEPPLQTEITIETNTEKRQFRFMNPALTEKASAPKILQLNEREEKIRGKAFSDELKTLMTEVASPITKEAVKSVTTADYLLRIEQFENAHRYPSVDQYLYYLNELYFDDVTADELFEAMRVASDGVQASAFAIMIYEPLNAVYRVGLSHDVPQNLKDYFYLLLKDSVFSIASDEYTYIEFSAALRKNPFFTKRFPKGLTEKFKGIHVFSLNESFLKARLVFFDDTRGGALDDFELISNTKSYLKQIAPAIKMFFIEAYENKGDVFRLDNGAVRELKESLALIDCDAPLIFQYVFERALSVQESTLLIQKIAAQLSNYCKAILLSPSHFIVLQTPAVSSTVEEVIRECGVEFLVKESTFGHKTHNLFAFIEF